MRHRFIRFILPFIIMLPMPAAASGIAVTLPPLAGLVLMLDEQAEISCLLPAGADPHHFQLTPRKIEQLQQQQLLIRSPYDDGGWPLPPHHAHTLPLWPDHDHGWLNPADVRSALPRIAEALIALRPQRSARIERTLQQALQQVDAIEQQWRQALEPLRSGGVIMQHPAWRRLMRAADVPVREVLESTRHGHEHGPHKLEHALSALKQHPDAWLIADAAHSNKALNWLARHAPRPPHRVTLNTLGQCGLPWPALMRLNIARIRQAQQP